MTPNQTGTNQLYATGALGVAEDAPEGANNGSGRPDAGEESDRQDVARWFGAFMAPNGGDPANPCGFPGYGGLYTGTPQNYRFILSHPTVRHVRHQIFAPILINTTAWVARKGTPEPWVEFARDTFPKLKARAFPEAIRAVDYGRYGFEKVWADRDGSRIIERLKPLAVDTMGILVDKGGSFAGLRWGGGDQQWLDRRKSFLLTYDGEAGDLYGRSRLENFRQTAWRDWLDCAQQIMWLAYKITGKLAIITTPSGTYPDANGQQRSWRDTALAAGRAIANPMANGVIWFPTAALPKSNTKENIDLLKIALVDIDVKDFGNHAPALEGLINRMRKDEELMSAGMLRSPRTSMESTHGSRADAEAHTDTDTTDSELLDMWYADAFNEQVVDDVMTLKFGERARGAVMGVPGRLRDAYKESDYKIIAGIMADPELRPQYLEKVDQQAIAERRSIPIKEGETMDLEAPDPEDVNEEDVPPKREEPANAPPDKEA